MLLLSVIIFPLIAGIPCRQFSQVQNGGYAIKDDMILSNHKVQSVLECVELCSWQSTCIAFNHRDIENEINCQLTNHTRAKFPQSFCDGEWTLFQDENFPSTLPSCYKLYSMEHLHQQIVQHETTNSSSSVNIQNLSSSNNHRFESYKSLNNRDTDHSNISNNFNNSIKSFNHSQTFNNYTRNSSSGQSKERFLNCADLFLKGNTRSGIYTIQPDHEEHFDVFCDMSNSGGGWTVVQKRYEGSVDFYQDWNNYSTGFGNLSGEFWLGLKKIHRLTKNENVTMRIDLEDFKGVSIHAEYHLFVVGDASENFALSVGSFKGSFDGLFYHNGMQFSTKDRDNDKLTFRHCAQLHKGGWWYKHCVSSNLNGIYYQHGQAADGNSGILWIPWKGSYESLKATQMKLRPCSFRET